MQTIQALHFGRGRTAPARAIVIHTVEAPENEGIALAVANYYAGSSSPLASMNFVVDDKEVIATVPLTDTAWAAPPLNAAGWHIEHAGYAKQTAADWADPYSVAELAQSAVLTASLCQQGNILPRRLTHPEIIRIIDGDTSVSGICGHVDVNQAMQEAGRMPQSTHWDPGPAFPWDTYIAAVQAILSPPKNEPTGVPLVATADEIKAIADASAVAVHKFPIHHAAPVGDVAFIQAFADLQALVAKIATKVGA